MSDNDIPEPSRPVMDRALLARFVAGEASPADSAAVERWLAEDPVRGAELADLQRIWRRAGVLPSDARLDGLWRDLQRRIHEEPVRRAQPALRVLSPNRVSAQRPWWARRWTVGALVAAGIAAIAIGVVHRSDRMPAGVVPASLAERVYRTPRGQRGVVELADGSRAHLGPDSRIRVRLPDGGRREVFLEGEAVFDVVHDDRRPFLVYARNAVTEDLGTRFGVRAYPGDSGVRVVVVSGEVALWSARGAAALDAGHADSLRAYDMGELDAGGTIRIHRGIEPDRYLAWTRDHVAFDQASVADIAVWLERWYDVDVVIADPAIAARRLTLGLDAPSLEETLNAITVPMGLRYEHVGRRVTLRH